MPRRLVPLAALLAVVLVAPASGATLEGRFQVVHVDAASPGEADEYRYYLRSPRAYRELRFDDAPALASGQRVRVEGTRRRDVVRVQDAEAVSAGTTAAATVSGTDDVLVLPITPTTPDAMTVAQLQARMGEAATFYSRSSYGGYGIRPRVSPWLKVPPQPDGCAIGEYAQAAVRAARSQGIEPDAYERVMVYLGPDIAGCDGWAGFGEVGGRFTWIMNGFFHRYVLDHELGHNVGLWHSHSLRCRDGVGAEVTISSTCEPIVEYGDIFDTMGSQDADFNAGQKDQLGWLAGRSATVATPVTAARTFSVAPMSSTSGVRALRIGARPYWVEYRRPVGNDAILGSYGYGTDGVLLHVPERYGDGTMNGTNLLDARPTGDGTFGDAPLPAGGRFDDPLGAFSLKVNSIGSTASVTVSPSAVAGAAYAYAAQPATASYAPAVQGSTHGGQVTVQRTAAGQYTVLLRRVGFAGGAAHVTALGAGDEGCGVRETQVVGSDAKVVVACHSAEGVLADSAFTVSWTKQIGTAAPFAHVVADRPSVASYTATGFSSGGAPTTVTRSSAGTYVVRLRWLAGTGGLAQVTAQGGAARTCQAQSWRADASDETVGVRCFNRAGTRVDTPFALTYARGTGVLGPKERVAASTFADQPTTASYAPKAWYTHNSTGGATSIVRSAPGTYAVRFAGVAAAAAKAGVAHVTPFGSDGSRCKLTGYATSGADRIVDVACRSAAGVKADRQFTVSWSA